MSRGEEPSSESENESDENKNEPAEEGPQYKHFETSSESEEEQKRVVRTMKDKRMDAFKAVITEIKNHRNINDFSAMLDDFANLNKELEKSKQLVEKEGLPPVYLKGLTYIYAIFCKQLIKRKYIR